MLKYLFSVKFSDGSLYVQNEQDISVHDKTRSCFYDVQRELDSGKQIELFTLSNESNFYLVNLETGEFEINNVPFFMHNDKIPGPFRLIYFRRHIHKFNIGAENEHSMTYNFGWQTTFNNENVQRVITIS